MVLEEVFPVEAGAYATAGEASTAIKRKLKQLGVDSGVLRRVSVASYEVELNLVIHSNYLRARQTWQSICSELPKTGAVEESGDITPYGDPAFVASYLTALAAEHDNILMVSHLPLVGYLVQSLCPAAGAPMFATSGLACIEWQDGKGVLLWLEGPHTIR